MPTGYASTPTRGPPQGLRRPLPPQLDAAVAGEVGEEGLGAQAATTLRRQCHS